MSIVFAAEPDIKEGGIADAEISGKVKPTTEIPYAARMLFSH